MAAGNPDAICDALGRLIADHETALSIWAQYRRLRQRLEDESEQGSIVDQTRRDEADAGILAEVAMMQLLEYPPRTNDEARRKALYVATQTRIGDDSTSFYALALRLTFSRDAETR